MEFPGLGRYRVRTAKTRMLRHLDEWKFITDLQNKEGGTEMQRKKMSLGWAIDFKMCIRQKM